MTQPSLDSLMREILQGRGYANEATPGEYWEELLAQLRQFREHVTHQPATKQANILETIQQIRSQQTVFLSGEEIDRQIQEERATWDS